MVKKKRYQFFDGHVDTWYEDEDGQVIDQELVSKREQEEFDNKVRKMAEKLIREAYAGQRLLYEQHTYRRPGDTVGRLVLVRRDTVHGLVGTYSNGRWIARCPGGVEVRLTTRDMSRGSRKLQGCGGKCGKCQPYRRKSRKLDFRTRPGSPRHLNQTYGRLTVREWVDRLGWLCECECGEFEYVRRSRELGPQGARDCPH